jgi:transcriptional regulator with XRE-family HTH domain
MATEATLRPSPELPPRALREALGVSCEQMARLLGVSAKSAERWEAGGKLPTGPAVRQRLAQLQEIAELGRMVYTPKGLVLFLQSRFPEFNGCTGLELIEGGEGERVIGALASDFEGVPS